MSKGKKIVIATSIILVSFVGFFINQNFNNPENVKSRCTAKYGFKYGKLTFDDLFFASEKYNNVIDNYYSCLGYEGDVFYLRDYIIDNESKFNFK